MIVYGVAPPGFRLPAETHVGIYQPDMAIACPACHQPLVCKTCGFAYGGDENGDPVGRPAHEAEE